MVQTVYANKIVFEISGIQHTPLERQLKNFTAQLTKFIGDSSPLPIQQPTDWFDAFLLLIKYLEPLVGGEKKVIFFDELPWLATRKSGFLDAFSYFWNSWASRENIVVVICGSSGSWMIQKVVHHKGGLHNRISRRIHLKAFSLGETAEYLRSRLIQFGPYQLLHLYMALGGVPHYLKEVKAGKSAIQNIDQICFSDGGLLKDEFLQLYPALFEQAETHIEVVRTLATNKYGLTRSQILAHLNTISGGGISKVLEELEQSGFITSYFPFGKKKRGKLFRLTDEYSLFYLQFIENKRREGAGTWQHLSQTQRYKSWSGYAFESICLKHIPQIKQALGISGVFSLSSSFYKKGTQEEKEAQIDLLLDRNDHIINLFEIKFYQEPFVLTKSYAEALREKMNIFRSASKTRKYLSWTLISPFGVQQNQHSLGLIETSLTMEDLFH